MEDVLCERKTVKDTIKGLYLFFPILYKLPTSKCYILIICLVNKF